MSEDGRQRKRPWEGPRLELFNGLAEPAAGSSTRLPATPSTATVSIIVMFLVAAVSVDVYMATASTLLPPAEQDASFGVWGGSGNEGVVSMGTLRGDVADGWAEGGVRGSRRFRLAVGIAGQLSRFSFETFAANVVAPNVDDASRVDVFAYLSNGGVDCKSESAKMRGTARSVYWPTIERDFGALVEGAGGHMMGFEVRAQLPITAIEGKHKLFAPSNSAPGQQCNAAQYTPNPTLYILLPTPCTLHSTP